MAIAFVKTLPIFSGAAPATSGTFTPTNNGDFLFYYGITGDGINENLVMTGTGTWTSLVQFNTSTTATYAIHQNANSTSSAQTVTLTDNTVGFVACYAGGVEYTGVGTTSGASGAQSVAPGLGAGAILGNSISVPTNSVLVALCIEPVNSETITATAGTSRASSVFNPSYRIQDYPGAGVAIQPAFTTSANGGATYFILQVILTPPAAPVVSPLLYHRKNALYFI